MLPFRLITLFKAAEGETVKHRETANSIRSCSFQVISPITLLCSGVRCGMRGRFTLSGLLEADQMGKCAPIERSPAEIFILAGHEEGGDGREDQIKV